MNLILNFMIETSMFCVYVLSFYLNTSALRLLALRGLRTLRVRRVALWAPEVTQSKLFLEFFPLYIVYCKQRSTNNFSYGSENMIFEIYTPETPCQPLKSSF